MKSAYRHIAIVFIIAIGLLGSTPLPAAAGESYQLDPAHTSIVFRVKHLDVAYFYGRFSEVSGTFQFDETSPSKNTIELTVKADKVDTGVEKRDKHLKSPDFFDAGKHPIISFKSKSVKKTANDTYDVAGDLTLLGKTRSMTVKAHGTGAGKDPWGNYRRGFETSFTVKRSDFGMDFMLAGLSDDVQVTVSVEGIRQ